MSRIPLVVDGGVFATSADPWHRGIQTVVHSTDFRKTFKILSMALPTSLEVYTAYFIH